MALHSIDLDPATGNCRMAQSADTPISAPFTVRLLASDYAHLDTYEEDADTGERRLVRHGVAFEYERRRDEIVAALPAPATTYSTSEYVAAVQAALDAAAQAHGYDDIFTACTYDGDEDPAFSAEGKAFKKWRSKVWRACYAAQANQPAVQPTPAEFVAALLAQFPAP